MSKSSKWKLGQKFKRDRDAAIALAYGEGMDEDDVKAQNEAWDKWTKDEAKKDKTLLTDAVYSHTPAASGWDTGTGIVMHEAGKLKEVIDAGGYVMIPYEIMNVIKYLCQEVKLEWQMFLVGNKVEGENFLITGYYIPKQEVGAASVRNIDVITPQWIKDNSIIAGIHSHGSMNTFYSSTDVEQSNKSTIELHIVVNNRLEFTAGRRWLLPNGEYVFLSVQVRTDREKFTVKPEGIDNITKLGYEFKGFRTEGV